MQLYYQRGISYAIVFTNWYMVSVLSIYYIYTLYHCTYKLYLVTGKMLKKIINIYENRYRKISKQLTA